MRFEAQEVLNQIAHLKLSHPDIWDDSDEQLLTDCLNGETEMNEFLANVVDRMQEASAFAGGIQTRMVELEERQGRFERREKAMRELAFKIMCAADVRKVELTEVTLVIAKGNRKLIGEVDPNSLPDNLVRIKREPDKKAIKGELESGRAVPGYELSNAEPHLTVRTK